MEPQVYRDKQEGLDLLATLDLKDPMVVKVPQVKLVTQVLWELQGQEVPRECRETKEILGILE